MSFKVGDFVVYKLLIGVFKVMGIQSYSVLAVSRDGYNAALPKVLLRHATAEEIAVGHRIDHCEDVFEKVEQGSNTSELEVLEMIDVSPNCEVSEL